jgi:hypothetical protein
VRHAVFLVLLAACADPEPAGVEGAAARVEGPDRDGDGYPEGEDCDDDNADVKPHADERCNGRDDDCDGEVDEDPVDPSVWFPDQDGDGHGDPDLGSRACAAPVDHVASAGDCDDSDAAVHPGADERCDGVDNDCDGATDESGAVDGALFFVDEDGDGHGDPGASLLACGAAEGLSERGDDCDDTDALRSPSAGERCDGVDNDCDGVVDESDAEGAQDWYLDEDGDGHGLSTQSTRSCEAPSGWVAVGGDCDDTSAEVHPGAEERCGGGDENCDGEVDEATALDALLWHADADGDGYGDAAVTVWACTLPAGHVADATDCDDTDAATSPGALEVCGGGDENCDGQVDESTASDAALWYADTDGDGYGDAASSLRACVAPSAHVADDTDCDDADAGVSPAAVELCGGGDENCDGQVDEATASDATDWHADTDGDGFGDAGSTVRACLAPSGHVADATDCDDGAAHAFPGGVEVCGDGVDGDCDGTVGSCGPQGSLGPGDALWSVSGAAGDGLGSGLAAVGDVDGDGYDDVLIGADGNGGGLAGLFLGPLSGTASLSTAAATLEGGSEDDAAGFQVAGMGDVDGDGYADLAVGAWAWEGGTATRNQGAVFLVHGPVSGSLDLDRDSDARLQGGALADQLGYALDRAGDHDGDGVVELLMGAFQSNTAGADAGSAYLHSADASGTVLTGSAVASVHGEVAGDQLGFSVAGDRDIDGDGVLDVILGARFAAPGSRTQAGAAYAFLGPLSGSLSAADADLVLQGAAAGDRAGWSVALVSDTDGDGQDDLLVGAVAESSAGTMGGAAYLVLGGTTGVLDLSAADAVFIGEGADDQAGRAVAGADLNADGRGDLAIGAYSEDTGATNAGAAYLVYGPVTGTLDLASADAVVRGDSAGQLLGGSLAGAGDLSGDGVDDLLIGVVGDDAGGTDAGRALLLAGEGW